MISFFFELHPNFSIYLLILTRLNPSLENMIARSSEIAWSPNILEFLILEYSSMA